LFGTPGGADFTVEKWKVTDKVNKWIIF